ncbi:methyltransferase domain-containing protein [Shewanella sp. JM162201]|uniref:Methyltransferase domain-containing protein n=1 Tax=Shewanella jiangmenensis TaxID=2837387 RepID=A0ABS5V8V2_9GAMM|nr:methyltransferase domain-containing protein [Shewanella jiangmenensis]MBT1446156.1 methyltransferase domain-containing protein [Shewanella jiangmenensis]
MRRCPLCLKLETRLFFQDRKRSFHVCSHCALVFADGASHLPSNAIRQRYGRGGSLENQRQLPQFILPLLQELQAQGHNQLKGLNYGRVLDQSSLAHIQATGHELWQYDPFMAPDGESLQHSYDFICCFRVFEHFGAPHREWQLFTRLLKPGGYLAMSTRMLSDPQRFNKWHHKNNLAHVSFPGKATFEYLASASGFRLIFAENDCILMQKPSGSAIKRDPNTDPAV